MTSYNPTCYPSLTAYQHCKLAIEFLTFFIPVSDIGKGVASPCGGCRQIIYEFGHATNCTVLMVKGEDECIRTTIKELLPEGFAGPDDLN